jgi:hypothetical protein
MNRTLPASLLLLAACSVGAPVELSAEGLDGGAARFVDADGDGFGDPARRAAAGEPGVANADDCDDADDHSHPGASEVGRDAVDQDCDGAVPCSVAPAPGPVRIVGADADAQVGALCARYDSLPAGLTVEDTPWVDLSALDCFCTVDGPVAIRDNPALTSLAGIPIGAHLGGSLGISGNATLVALRGLDELVQVDGDLVLAGNPVLDEAWGLHRLSVVEGDLLVGDDGAAFDGGALAAVQLVGGRYAVGGQERRAMHAAVAAAE